METLGACELVAGLASAWPKPPVSEFPWLAAGEDEVEVEGEVCLEVEVEGEVCLEVEVEVGVDVAVLAAVAG